MSAEHKQRTLARIVGQQVRGAAQWETIPVGAVLRHENGSPAHVWTKVSENRAASGYHMYPDGLHQQRVNFNHFGNDLYHVIGDFTRFYAAKMEGTLDGYKARFKQAIITGANRNSVSTDTVNRALRDLECDGITGGITLGGPLLGQDLEQLPVNSVVVFGDPGSDTFTLWRKHENGQWVATLAGDGRLPETNNQRILVTAPGVEGVWVAPTEAQTEAEAQAINEFKARAYRVGLRQKRAHGWCDVYDNIMESVGITREAITTSTVGGYRLGAIVQAEDAHTLPNGCVLYSISDTNRFHLFIRDDAMTNMARTRLLVSGDGAGANYNRRMRLGSGNQRTPGDSLLPDEPSPLGTRLHMEQLPVGTQFMIGTDQQNVWTITTPDHNNRFVGYRLLADVERAGWDTLPQGVTTRYRTNDFGDQPLHIVTVPDPNNPGRSIH